MSDLSWTSASTRNSSTKAEIATAAIRALDSAKTPNSLTDELRHPGFVRITHWLTVIAFFALLVSGLEIVVSHPRFYWGETGNVNTQPLFNIPIPSSRYTVPTGYKYVLPDQNGWSRYLHFEAAWLLVITGTIYVAFGTWRGHFRRNLMPRTADLRPKSLFASVGDHLRFKRPGEEETRSYNVLQRLSYAVVIFVMFPLIIWTGLAMSPAVSGAAPWLPTLVGGRQSARTIHFFLTGALVLFLLVHVFMVFFAGFWPRTRAMITGRVTQAKERV